MDQKTIPDIPLGMAWSKHWVEHGYDSEYGLRIAYPHYYPPSFPQAKSNPQWPWCYPEDALSAFRRWLRHDFLKVGLPKYLSNKAAKGEIAPPVAKAVLSALNPPAPRLR